MDLEDLLGIGIVLMAVVILTLLKHNRPLTHGGHVESQENKSFVFALNLHLAEACHVKTKLFYSPSLNMAAM